MMQVARRGDAMHGRNGTDHRGMRGAARAGVFAVALLLPVALSAQAAPTISPAMDRAVARARAAVDNGEGDEARAVLDSLVDAAPAASNDLAEALFWRATLSERLSDAERDWKRLVIEVPLAPRSSDALSRLGELEMLRGRPADARSYFARIVREYPAGAAKARAQLWMAKSWAAQRDLPRACVALAEASATGVPEGELRLQAEEMGRQCATVDRKLIAQAAADTASAAALASPPTAPPATAVPPTPTPVTTPAAATPPAKSSAAPATGRFSVQLAAFDTREEGERLVKRLATRNIEARVDGDVKPFRVRTGYYATRAAANAALAKLKQSGQTGFIAEIVK
jgi:cell division septation protein DedD